MRPWYRLLSLCLVIVLLNVPGAPLAPERVLAGPSPAEPTIIYIVHAGDTLYNIAARYRANIAALAQLNGITNPALVYIGQRLVVPGAPPTPTPASQTSVIHVVQPGETLFRIALRYNTTVWAIVSANRLENSSLIYAGQQLVIPSEPPPAPDTPEADLWPAPFTGLKITPLPVVQGHVMVIAVRTIKPVTLQGSFLDWLIPFAHENGTYYALIGIHAMQKVGVYPLTITATDEQGQQVAVSQEVSIVAGTYGSERIDLAPDKQALLDPALVNAEREKLWSVFAIFRPERSWRGLFGWPVQGKISSVFGTRRSYSGGPFNSYHEGLDFSANGGTPVLAPEAGVVVLAEPLTVRGNAVIIDHGWGVHSGFYHLSEITVSAGQQVQKGQLIGRVGSTGLSTGNHLHWDLRVRGLNVDPAEWTQRVFP